jgi:hypothetical protein
LRGIIYRDTPEGYPYEQINIIARNKEMSNNFKKEFCPKGLFQGSCIRKFLKIICNLIVC